MNFKSLYNLNLVFVNFGGKAKYILHLPSLCKTLKLLKPNKALINNRKYDTIYICGLGPSLADVDLDKLDDAKADTLVVNYFIKMSEKTKLRPTYYMMADAGFVSPKHRPALEKAVKIYPNSKFIWNSSFPKLDPTIMDYSCEKYFLAMYKGYYIEPQKFDITKITPAFGNCICAAIAFAIGVGYKKIILLGCDFNSFAFPHEVHCYDGGRNNKSARRISLDFELFCYSFDATVHLKLAEYARQQKIEIKNATRGSLIDAYEKIDMPELYKC